MYTQIHRESVEVSTMFSMRWCDCGQPLAPMQRLAVDGADSYYLCDQCATIRVEISIEATTGTMGAVAFYPANDPTLPAVVREHV